MTKQINFTYKSIGNFSKLLSTILYEKEHTAKEITLWHLRFDGEETDDLFEKFLYELFPNGGTLNVEEIKLLTKHAEKFLFKDPIAKQQRVEYEKREYTLWVYFKIDQTVIPCEFAQHQETIRKICIDYFKDFEINDITPDYIKKFIIDNFEIRSDNLTVERIANDSLYIFHSIVFDERNIARRRAVKGGADK